MQDLQHVIGIFVFPVLVALKGIWPVLEPSSLALIAESWFAHTIIVTALAAR
ncbi:hypothetical protein [Hyphomicrobium sulfonivorans]|uniref:hypothetical protein n=1 Tax=Hyphomicrobium sulfonivorans TaxID=121290 RepID=UPI000B19284D|nr:hypothetical protein [Hyphomicrobium sulfonivorans]